MGRFRKCSTSILVDFENKSTGLEQKLINGFFIDPNDDYHLTCGEFMKLVDFCSIISLNFNRFAQKKKYSRT